MVVTQEEAADFHHKERLVQRTLLQGWGLAWPIGIHKASIDVYPSPSRQQKSSKGTKGEEGKSRS